MPVPGALASTWPPCPCPSPAATAALLYRRRSRLTSAGPTGWRPPLCCRRRRHGRSSPPPLPTRTLLRRESWQPVAVRHPGCIPRTPPPPLIPQTRAGEGPSGGTTHRPPVAVVLLVSGRHQWVGSKAGTVPQAAATAATAATLAASHGSPSLPLSIHLVIAHRSRALA